MRVVTEEQAAALCVAAEDWMLHWFGGLHLQTHNFSGLEGEKDKGSRYFKFCINRSLCVD